MKNKKSFYEIQTALQDAITNRIFPDCLADTILEKPPISIDRRLEIYQDAYEIRMVESLREDFPAVAEALVKDSLGFKGDDPFETMALEYLKEYPSKYYNLAEVSQNFPEFIKTKSVLLFELAVQDWLKMLSSYAPEPKSDSIVSAEAIQQGEAFLLKKHPATFAVTTDHHYYLSYRYLWDSYVYEISLQEAGLIEFMKSAKTLEEFSSRCFEMNFDELKMSELLAHWMNREIIYCERITK